MEQPEALAWVAALFDEASGSLSPDTRRDEIPAWDSLGVLSLMAALDGDFGITLSDDEVQGINTVNDILDILRRKGTITSQESPDTPLQRASSSCG